MQEEGKSRATSPPRLKQATGVKIVLGVVVAILALLALGAWGFVRALL